MEEKDEVSEAKLRIQGKIIYVNVSFTDKINMAKGKEIAATVFEKFSSEELKFYDFSFLINQTSENEEAELWSSAGSKNTEEVKISWAKS